MALAVGMVVDDRYLLEAQIGSGGMARVFRATNRKNGKRVALKEVYIPANDQAETLRGWFKREIRALMVLDHPNVLQLIDHGETDSGEPFVVTELLEGKDLEDSLTARGTLPAGAIVDIAAQALAAFEKAHGMTIVHRDIKPGNLFLCDTGRLVVLDFGLARATTPEVGATLAQGFGTKILGTPQYWSPEQIKGVTLDPTSDIFSLGGTLYFLATGGPPYKGNTPFEIATSIMMKKRTPLQEAAPNLAPELCAVIESMLAEEPADRPTASQLVAKFADLEERFPRHRAELMGYIGKTPTPPPVADAPVPEDTQTGVLSGSIAISTPTQLHQIETIVQKIQKTNPNQTSIVTVAQTSKTSAGPKRSWLPLAAGGVAVIAVIAVGVALAIKKPSAAPPPPPVAALTPPPPAQNDLPQPGKEDVPKVPPRIKEDPPPERPKPAPEPAGPGTLNCQLKQYAEVFVDGLSIGTKRIATKIALQPGKHEILFKNPKFGERAMSFVIKAGKETPCKLDFETN